MTRSLTRADVQLINGSEFLITAKNGPVEVILEKEMLVVPQNQSARVSVRPEDPKQDKEAEGAGKENLRWHRMKAVWIFTGVSAVIVVPILLKNAVSPHVIP